MLNAIKRKLIKRWSKEIAVELANASPTPVLNCGKNRAGLGGQNFTPHYILLSSLAEQSRDPEIKFWRNDSIVVKETLFYEYFGPFEHWCDTYCQSDYYLWCDKVSINRVFTDPRDEMYYRLIFSGSMPTMNEIYETIVDRALEK